ncbi:MAG: thioredoxin domain-containing protein [Planctomycetaceae bacterium]
MSKRMVFQAAGMALTLTIVSYAIAAGATQTPSWHTDFAAAQAEAKKQNKPMLVHFHATWCGPCQQMEQEVLKSTELSRVLAGQAILVKIDTDDNADLVEKYQIESLPSDLFLNSSGQVISRYVGYQDKAKYLASMTKSVVKHQQYIAAQKPAPANKQPVLTAKANVANVNTTLPIATAKDENGVMVGLDKYSPVALWHHRTWLKGNPEFSHVHKGVTYYLNSADELAKFQANPEQYAPKLLGCDPVILTETDRAISGSTKFGAYFDGDLYVFANETNRDSFKKNPTRYTRTQHVLNTDLIGETVRR